VFIDDAGSREWNESESYQRIVAAIEEAGLDLTVVTRAEEASIILVFRYIGGTRPQWFCSGPYCAPDRASGEVYIRDGDTLRVVLLFEEQLNAWRTKLARRFAERFVDAYRDAGRR
jgi:hypothetical protein